MAKQHYHYYKEFKFDSNADTLISEIKNYLVLNGYKQDGPYGLKLIRPFARDIHFRLGYNGVTLCIESCSNGKYGGKWEEHIIQIETMIQAHEGWTSTIDKSNDPHFKVNIEIPGGSCTKSEYRKNYLSMQRILEIDEASTDLYIIVLLNLALCIGLLIWGAPFILVLADVIIMTCLTVGIHLFRSEICAIIFLVYSSIGTFLAMIENGRPTGFLIVAFSFLALKAFNNVNKDYKTMKK